MHGIEILIFGNDSVSAESQALLLRLFRQRVHFATSTTSAFQRVRSFTPDVLALEIALRGGIEGYEASSK